MGTLASTAGDDAFVAPSTRAEVERWFEAAVQARTHDAAAATTAPPPTSFIDEEEP